MSDTVLLDVTDAVATITLNRPDGMNSLTVEAKVALNGRKRQQGPVSIRQLKAELAGLRGLVAEMTEARSLAAGGAIS